MEKYNIEMNELNGTKEEARGAIGVGVYIKFYGKMTKDREERSKLKYFLEGKGFWKPEDPAAYMEKLTRKQASTIFKARTRMTKIKGNYKNEHPDLCCRACKNYPETHLHALNECEILHNPTATSTESENTHCEISDLFSDDTEKLKNEAIKIDNICEKLNET